MNQKEPLLRITALENKRSDIEVKRYKLMMNAVVVAGRADDFIYFT